VKQADCKYCQQHDTLFLSAPDRDCIHTCCGCGFWGDRVECSGIYYCPNPLCRACGVTNTIIARCKREGVPVYEADGRYTVQDTDIRRVQQLMVREIGDEALLAFLRERYPSFMAELDG
jgi:hypothetical protein